MAVDYNRLNGPQRKVLREALTRVFNRGRLRIFLEDNQFEPLENLVEAGRFSDEVFELIKELAATGALNKLMARVEAEFADSPAMQDLPPKLSATAAEVETQAAMLQAGGLEKLIRDTPIKDLIPWTDTLAGRGASVCRIRYTLSSGGVGYGSGLLVGRQHVLTNYHVMEHVAKGKATRESVRVSFGYAETGKGLGVVETFGVAAIVAQSPYGKADLKLNAGLPSAQELDFALLRLDRAVPAKRKRIRMEDAVEVKAGDIVLIVQHPGGDPLKLSLGMVKEPVTPLRVRYDANTLAGSSGSLVLDAQLRPVALHHASDPRPETIVKAEYNQGIPFALVLAALQQESGIEVFWKEPPEPDEP